MKCILATKLGMTQLFNEQGDVVPVTLVKTEECFVAGHRTEEKDTYSALILASGSAKRCQRSVKGQMKDLKACPTPKNVTELRCAAEDLESQSIGSSFKASDFEAGEMVTVMGTTKGKGFAGVVKRHHFAGASATHGHKHDERKPGSIGCAFPEHVIKGRRMAGHMGRDRQTLHKIPVVAVDVETGIIALKGGLPGGRNAQLKITA